MGKRICLKEIFLSLTSAERKDFLRIMADIFNLVGSLFGYILWAAFWAVKNFGLAIIIFTIIVKLILLPFSIKQQKATSANARFQKKQREIMEKYGNDRAKANEEVQKLMQKEGISPTAGCSTMIAPMIVMLGVYYSVISPLSNTIHIAGGKVSEAVQSFSALPVIGSSINVRYGEISILKYFDVLQKYLTDTNGNSLFGASDVEKISEFKNGFNFLGLDLLATPSTSSFQSMMWLIPVLCFATSVGSMLLMQKMQGTKMQGCMMATLLMLPLMSAWIAYTVPGAVGFYWIASTVLGFLQSLLMNIFYNASIIEARTEAHRIELRRNQEKEVEFVEAPDYVPPSQKIADIKPEIDGSNKNKKQKKKSNSNKSKSDYQGRKK